MAMVQLTNPSQQLRIIPNAFDSLIIPDFPNSPNRINGSNDTVNGGLDIYWILLNSWQCPVTIDGGAGSDTVFRGQDDDPVSGGTGDDSLSGDRGNDTVNGGLDNKILYWMGINMWTVDS
jgi:Ca2+-binding RTX toxin-like protein